jgi:hypothetical protein
LRWTSTAPSFIPILSRANTASFERPSLIQKFTPTMWDCSKIDWLIVGVLTPRSTIFELYRGDQFLWWRKPEYRENHGQATGKLYHMRLRVECALFVIYKAELEPTPYWW